MASAAKDSRCHGLLAEEAEDLESIVEHLHRVVARLLLVARVEETEVGEDHEMLALALMLEEVGLAESQAQVGDAHALEVPPLVPSELLPLAVDELASRLRGVLLPASASDVESVMDE